MQLKRTISAVFKEVTDVWDNQYHGGPVGNAETVTTNKNNGDCNAKSIWHFFSSSNLTTKHNINYVCFFL